ncbi:MAG: histidine phosphatase family protein [Paraburkholderia sp.]|nr:MAG: histidine phosphatase family protein [Paraburkholderia sp.]
MKCRWEVDPNTAQAPRRLFRLWLSRSLTFAAAAAAAAGTAQAAAPLSETIVFVRHGEKPAHGYGQLDCEGLNRALALPAVIAAKFGKPDALYAPNPSIRKKDEGVPYDYVRPLATIEPTAIQYGMPVDTRFGYAQIDALEKALIASKRRGELVVVAWEHHEIEALVRRIMQQYGASPQAVPHWRSGDFDAIYVVKLDWAAQSAAPTATFALDSEGLDGRTKDCPCAALPDAPAPSSSIAPSAPRGAAANEP